MSGDFDKIKVAPRFCWSYNSFCKITM